MKRRGNPPKPSNRKCIRKYDGTIVRLPNADAHTLVSKGSAVYVPKHEWKATK